MDKPPVLAIYGNCVVLLTVDKARNPLKARVIQPQMPQPQLIL